MPKTKLPDPPPSDVDENPEWTEEMFSHARPFAEVFPEWAETRRRGRPPLERPKQPVNLRLDADVLDAFRATGPGWQTRINEALRAALPLKPPASSR
jgi:uncharacterized protein (DUF4415 family)